MVSKEGLGRTLKVFQFEVVSAFQWQHHSLVSALCCFQYNKHTNVVEGRIFSVPLSSVHVNKEEGGLGGKQQGAAGCASTQATKCVAALLFPSAQCLYEQKFDPYTHCYDVLMKQCAVLLFFPSYFQSLLRVRHSTKAVLHWMLRFVFLLCYCLNVMSSFEATTVSWCRS